MICDKYKDDVLEAAVSGQAHERLEKHLDQCASCREALKSARDVLAKIHCVLNSRMGEEPSAGFLARTRAQIAHDQERGKNAAWGLTAAIAGLMLIAFLNLWTSPRHLPTDSNRFLSSATPEKQKPAAAPVQNMPGVVEAARVPTPTHVTQPAHLRILSASTPDVLVPPDEGRAFRRFVVRLAQQQEIAEAFVSRPVEQTVEQQNELADISPVEIADLRVVPLAWERWREPHWSGQYVARKITSESEQK